MYRILFGLILIGITIITPIHNVNAQGTGQYEKGEVTLKSSSLLEGLVRITESDDGSAVVLYKKSVYEAAEQFSSFDVVSVILLESKKLYVSMEDPNHDNNIVLMETHFTGGFTLSSFNEDKSTSYLLIDPDGERTILINTFSLPDRSNNYTMTFNREFRGTLLRIFEADNYMFKEIESSDFTAKSLSKVLAKYHQKNEMKYSIYPPPSFSFFAGIRFNGLMLSHASDLAEGFTSLSPLAGASATGGFDFRQGLLVASFDLGVNYGIIFHDITDREDPLLTMFYEDKINTSVLTTGINLGTRPKKFGPISPELEIGFGYNIYLNYSREVITEELNIPTNEVRLLTDDSFIKPSGFLGAKVGGGIVYEINQAFSVKAGYSYNIYLGKSTDFRNAQIVSLSITRKFY